ncbi:MAG: transcriptional regulator [Euryarchaeota archaeon RBG_13_31_8]|nr:MAG: transcriptional regulator [Euryarchaeota archaeon RBG_13_31_8]
MSAMIDKKDEIILNELKKNARNTTKNIGKTLKIPRVTVHDRIQKMAEKGIIKSFTIIPDYKNIGLSCTVFIFVAFQSDVNISQRELAKRIALLPNVFEVHIISGEYDLLVKVRGTSLEEIGKLIVDKLRLIRGVGRTLTCTCFETVKEEI